MDLNLDIHAALTEHERATAPPAPEPGKHRLPVPPAIVPEKNLSGAQWGMLAFLVSEVAFFGALMTAYVTYLGADTSGPTPREALSLPLAFASTLCLVASSWTIHLAEGHQREGRARQFLWLWAGTIALGVVFLLGTAYEWRELIVVHRLTISRNLFGTTFYTLVGFHALHVTIGLLTMLAVLGVMLSGRVPTSDRALTQLVSWYWHFVDVVWIAVFALVYLIGR
jgi:cytochrome c oxidase subunit 3